MAFFQAASSWSKEIPKISKLLDLNFSYKATKLGLATRHGLHHEAQNSIQNILPFQSR